MGIDRLHAIVVSSWNEAEIDQAHKAAVRIFNKEDARAGYGLDIVTPVMISPINGVYTFFVGPDGGKEPGAGSRLGDARRAAFVGWLKTQTYEDGTSRLRWVEVQYGDDYGETRVVIDSDAAFRAALDS